MFSLIYSDEVTEEVLISVRNDMVNPYGQIKDRLVSCCAQTEWKIDNKLLDVPELGD
jgi:hypothetical protein